MCLRVVKLKSYIQRWLENEISLSLALSTRNSDRGGSAKDLTSLQLAHAEWQHLESVTRMLHKFKKATEALSQKGTVQISYVWLMYNRLFDFIDDIEESLGSRNSTGSDRKSTRLNSSHSGESRMPSSA